jgi:uncharacterized protein YbdZ (MbtH family)
MRSRAGCGRLGEELSVHDDDADGWRVISELFRQHACDGHIDIIADGWRVISELFRQHACDGHIDIIIAE